MNFQYDVRCTTKLFLALALVLALGGCASTQLPEAPDDLPSAKPFKNANIIYVDTDTNSEEALEQMRKALTLQDYELTQSLSQGDMVTTRPRSFGSGVGGSARYYIRTLEDGRLKITGEFVPAKTSDRAGFEQMTAHTVAARGGRLSTSRAGWRRMREIAESYSGATLMYDSGRVDSPTP